MYMFVTSCLERLFSHNNVLIVSRSLVLVRDHCYVRYGYICCTLIGYIICRTYVDACAVPGLLKLAVANYYTIASSLFILQRITVLFNFGSVRSDCFWSWLVNFWRIVANNNHVTVVIYSRNPRDCSCLSTAFRCCSFVSEFMFVFNFCSSWIVPLVAVLYLY